VALTHHHPLSLTDLNFRMYDNSDYIENGDVLINVIDKYNFGLFIHGHKHRAQLRSTESVTLFCAGSFSAKQNTQLGDDENLFHIIEIDMATPKKGIIHSWSYGESSAWKPSCHFPETTGFGAIKNGTELANEIGTYLKEKYQDELATVQYQDIVEQFPEVQYLHKKEKDEFFTKLEDFNCLFTKGYNNKEQFIINSGYASKHI
jgi:hypothetical protein